MQTDQNWRIFPEKARPPDKLGETGEFTHIKLAPQNRSIYSDKAGPPVRQVTIGASTQIKLSLHVN
jgi:hypothetical protein